jgi:hypothetical protein
VNFTFEDASSSAASESEIQSDGGFDIGQSGSFEVGPEAVPLADDSAPEAVPVSVVEDPAPEVVPASFVEDSAPSPELAPASLDSARLGLAELDRSLRAQPLPLKWTAGAANARFIAPPHLGQFDGPWPWTECITSIVWPQLEQT